MLQVWQMIWVYNCLAKVELLDQVCDDGGARALRSVTDPKHLTRRGTASKMPQLAQFKRLVDKGQLSGNPPASVKIVDFIR